MRGPVLYLAEEFNFTGGAAATLAYSGELGTDFGAAGQWWGGQVAPVWEAAVRASFATIWPQAQRRTAPGAASLAGSAEPAPLS